MICRRSGPWWCTASSRWWRRNRPIAIAPHAKAYCTASKQSSLRPLAQITLSTGLGRLRGRHSCPSRKGSFDRRPKPPSAAATNSLQLDQREPIAARLFRLLLLRRCRRLLARLSWLARLHGGGPGRLRRRARGRRRFRLIERAIVDAPRRAGRGFSPRNDLHRNTRSRCRRAQRAPVLGQGKHALSLDADGDVLPVDDEAVEHRVLPRRLQPLEHLRERLLADRIGREVRSEEHTSELQSRLHLVCRLLLEKKKKLAGTSVVMHTGT